MTPTQVFVVGAIGGLAAIVGLILLIGLAVGLYLLVAHVLDVADEHREQRRRRRDRVTCQAILTLPTTEHPTEPR